MIPRFLGFVMVFLTIQLGASASPKIALVRVKDIYTEQPATKAAQDKARKDKEAVLLDPRAEELREGIEALRQLQKKISDPKNPPSNDEGRMLARQFELKRLETSSLQEEFEKFRAAREKEINTEMVAEMRRILNHIVATAQRTGREKGFELVLDSSGSTNTSAPFVLYARKAPDLTDDVLAAIKNESAPQQGAENPPPPSPPADPQPQP